MDLLLMILMILRIMKNIYVNEIDEFNAVFDELFNEMNDLGAQTFVIYKFNTWLRCKFL